MENKNLNVRQILEYAKENGFDSVMFSLKKDGSHFVAGKFLDAYFEFVQIPFLGDGFVTMSDLEKNFGHDIFFDVLDEEGFLTVVRFDFLLRGKELPEKYKFPEKG